jgi:hypothetical protein
MYAEHLESGTWRFAAQWPRTRTSAARDGRAGKPGRVGLPRIGPASLHAARQTNKGDK